MKTPYDTALRAIKREVDEMRGAIRDAADDLVRIERARQAASEALGRELDIAAANRFLPTQTYFAQSRMQREQLAAQRNDAIARLDALRRKAAERYGSMRVMEGVAQDFQADAERDIAKAEMLQIDDIGGARFSAALRIARRVARWDGRAG